MKPQAHTHEDKLLEFAYGELPPDEARSLEAHLKGCTRCTDALSSIRGVRRTMAQLPAEPAPDAGLESLLAYAQQAARRSSAGPEPEPKWWRRWVVATATVAGLVLVGVVGVNVLDLQKTEGPAVQVLPEVKLAPAPPPPPKDFARAAEQAGAPLREEAKADAVAEAPPAAAAPLQDEFAARKKSLGGLKKERAYGNEGGSGGERKVSTGSSRPRPAPEAEAADDLSAYAQRNTMNDAPTTRRPAPSAGSVYTEKRKDAPAEEEHVSFEKLASKKAAEPASPPPKQVAESAGPAAKADQDRQELAQAIGALDGKGGLGLGAAGSGRDSRGGTANKEQERDKAAAQPSKPVAVTSSAAPEAPQTAQSLWAAAQAERKRGDRAAEANLLRAALGRSPSASLRSNLLAQLCEAEEALGGGMDACERVVAEFPNSGAATTAQRRMRARAVDDAKKASPALQ